MPDRGPVFRVRPRMSRRAVLAAAAAVAVSGCGGGGRTDSPHAFTNSQRGAGRKVSIAATGSLPGPRSRPIQPSYPRLLRSAQRLEPTPFVPAVMIDGRTAAWIARSQSGIVLLSFDQSLVTLRLHSGTVDAGGSGWRWGPDVSTHERRNVVAAFNGGFKLDTGAGGFMSYGRVAAPLRNDLGSIVTYDDGTTDVGSWHREVPWPGRPVVSVRQNLSLLIDQGNAASNVDCLSCWGATLGGVSAPARSALGITADRRLIWVGGEHLTATELTTALRGARVIRAVELDINPEWVAAYFYGHREGIGPLAPVPVVPGQPGVRGQFLVPYGRDFFSVQAR